MQETQQEEKNTNFKLFCNFCVQVRGKKHKLQALVFESCG